LALAREEDNTLVTSVVVLTVGKHYWEVELLNEDNAQGFIGVTRPNLNPNVDYADMDSTDRWFIFNYGGSLYGNGENGDAYAGPIVDGDRVGVLLDLDEGSLRFFVNGVQHGPGYPAGSVTGPMVCAVQMAGACGGRLSVRLLPQDTEHALLQ
jgi:hypothetical protein